MAAVVAGDANLRGRPEQTARLFRVAVALPQMHAVRTKLMRQIHAIVEDKRDVAFGADRHQGRCRRQYVVIARPFEAKLECRHRTRIQRRSEEHTSELQSLMRISYAVFCLKKKKT